MFQHDFLVISCDLISDVNLNGVINTFRQHSAALVALLFASGIPKYTSPAPGSTKTDKKHGSFIYLYLFINFLSLVTLFTYLFSTVTIFYYYNMNTSLI